MKTLKMSLENIQGKMSRSEMKNIMGGFDLNELELDNSCANNYCKSSSECCPGASHCVPIGNMPGHVCARV